MLEKYPFFVLCVQQDIGKCLSCLRKSKCYFNRGMQLVPLVLRGEDRINLGTKTSPVFIKHIMAPGHSKMRGRQSEVCSQMEKN